MDVIKPLENRQWFVGIVCAIGLLLSWASFWVVYAALPADTRLAHWALEVLVLAATGGFLLISERLLLIIARRFFPRRDEGGSDRVDSTARVDIGHA